MINLNENNESVKLEIWDTAGQEKFKSINRKYYWGIMGIILLFDVSDYNSFANINSWIQ